MSYQLHQLFAQRNIIKKQTVWDYYKITGLIHSKDNPKRITEEGHFDKIEVTKVAKELDQGTEVWRETEPPFDIDVDFIIDNENRKEIIFKK